VDKCGGVRAGSAQYRKWLLAPLAALIPATATTVSLIATTASTAAATTAPLVTTSTITPLAATTAIPTLAATATTAASLVTLASATAQLQLLLRIFQCSLATGMRFGSCMPGLRRVLRACASATASLPGPVRLLSCRNQMRRAAS